MIKLEKFRFQAQNKEGKQNCHQIKNVFIFRSKIECDGKIVDIVQENINMHSVPHVKMQQTK